MDTEDYLNFAFARRLEESREFRLWVLCHTRFSQYASNAELLNEEQARVRQRADWWRNWECHVPELNRRSASDMFICYAIQTTSKRFALHISFKLAESTFFPEQPKSYELRGRYMLKSSKSAKLRCCDFDTIIIAPHSFLDAHRAECDLFGCSISHEDVAKYIPAFAACAPTTTTGLVEHGGD